MGRFRLRGRNWVKSIFLDSYVDTGSTKHVDPGTCLTWQNQSTHLKYTIDHSQRSAPFVTVAKGILTTRRQTRQLLLV